MTRGRQGQESRKTKPSGLCLGTGSANRPRPYPAMLTSTATSGPGDTYHVLDADSSQSLAIHEATSGSNLVIQGPPGTGKSQTICNIIADAVGRGKRVLFVAEKMAALEVVKHRLDNIGLGQVCLELHSHKTNKREILADLARITECCGPGRKRRQPRPVRTGPSSQRTQRLCRRPQHPRRPKRRHPLRRLRGTVGAGWQRHTQSNRLDEDNRN